MYIHSTQLYNVMPRILHSLILHVCECLSLYTPNGSPIPLCMYMYAHDLHTAHYYVQVCMRIIYAHTAHYYVQVCMRIIYAHTVHYIHCMMYMMCACPCMHMMCILYTMVYICARVHGEGGSGSMSNGERGAAAPGNHCMPA